MDAFVEPEGERTSRDTVATPALSVTVAETFTLPPGCCDAGIADAEEIVGGLESTVAPVVNVQVTGTARRFPGSEASRAVSLTTTRYVAPGSRRFRGSNVRMVFCG